MQSLIVPADSVETAEAVTRLVSGFPAGLPQEELRFQIGALIEACEGIPIFAVREACRLWNLGEASGQENLKWAPRPPELRFAAKAEVTRFTMEISETSKRLGVLRMPQLAYDNGQALEYDDLGKPYRYPREKREEMLRRWNGLVRSSTSGPDFKTALKTGYFNADPKTRGRFQDWKK